MSLMFWGCLGLSSLLAGCHRLSHLHLDVVHRFRIISAKRFPAFIVWMLISSIFRHAMFFLRTCFPWMCVCAICVFCSFINSALCRCDIPVRWRLRPRSGQATGIWKSSRIIAPTRTVRWLNNICFDISCLLSESLDHFPHACCAIRARL